MQCDEKKESDIGLLVLYEGVTNERFVVVLGLRGLGYVVAFLSRYVISLCRGGGNRWCCSEYRPSFLHLETLASSITCVYSYRWTYNGAPFDPSGTDGRITIQPGSGALTFTRPIRRDEARYQCVAYNGVGVALSDKVNLRRASEFISVMTDSLNAVLYRMCSQEGALGTRASPGRRKIFSGPNLQRKVVSAPPDRESNFMRILGRCTLGEGYLGSFNVCWGRRLKKGC